MNQSFCYLMSTFFLVLGFVLSVYFILCSVSETGFHCYPCWLWTLGLRWVFCLTPPQVAGNTTVPNLYFIFYICLKMVFMPSTLLATFFAFCHDLLLVNFIFFIFKWFFSLLNFETRALLMLGNSIVLYPSQLTDYSWAYSVHPIYMYIYYSLKFISISIFLQCKNLNCFNSYLFLDLILFVV